MNNKLCCILMGIIVQNTTSASMTTFISVDAGAPYSNPFNTQNVRLLNTLGNTYEAKQQWQHDYSVMVGVGLRAYDEHDVIINTSVRLLPMINMHGSGDVLQLYSPRFRNLAYSYDMSSNVLLAEQMVTWTAHSVQPGVILGLGGASNTAKNYQEISLNSHAVPALDHFRNNTQTQFSYELGAVLDYPVKDVVFEFAYRFLDTGQGQLGLSPLQNTTQHLSTGSLHYHVISLGVRFDHTV